MQYEIMHEGSNAVLRINLQRNEKFKAEAGERGTRGVRVAHRSVDAEMDHRRARPDGAAGEVRLPFQGDRRAVPDVRRYGKREERGDAREA